MGDMSKHQTGSMICPTCGKSFKWMIFHYADILGGEEVEWTSTEGYAEVNTQNNTVMCPYCTDTVKLEK